MYYQHLVSCRLFPFASGDSIIVGGDIFTQTGVYTSILTSANGCDSTIITDLTVFPTISVTNFQTVCEGDTYLIGNSSYTMPGSYTDILTSINGCDSLVNTNLTVYPISVVNNNYVICEGDIVTVGNNSYFEEGDYIDTIQTIYGCDSIINSYIQWSLPIVSLAQLELI